jgi:glycosyltransferase involved in cell wall biosynthesis
MSKKTPKISAVMPFYNREKYIGQAIQSILDQTFTDFELILVDDGSTDDSQRIVKKYKKLDPRITLITLKKNCGISKARNIGTRLAQADVIAIVDSDDINLSERFEQQYRYLEKNKNISIVGAAASIIDANGVCTGKMIKYHENAEMIKRSFLHYGPFLQPTVMIRKKAFFAVGGYREKYKMGEDLDLFWRIIATGHRGVNLDNVLVQYRQHKDATGVYAAEKRDIVRHLKKDVIQKYDIVPSYRDLISIYVWSYLWQIMPKIVIKKSEDLVKYLLYEKRP